MAGKQYAEKISASRPISRVLCSCRKTNTAMVIHLGPSLLTASLQPTRTVSPGNRLADGSARCPYSVLLPVGFTMPLAVAGSAVGSYPTLSALPRQFTDILHFGWAVFSLLHFPWGRPRRVLPGTVFPWSPDFPLPTLFRSGRQRPSGRLTGTMWRLVQKRSKKNARSICASVA